MPIDLPDLLPFLRTSIIGRTVLAAETVASTNQVLLDEARAGAPHGTLATCENQTAGRGRHRRLWHSPPGKNLYFSLLLRPRVPALRLPQLAVITALALRRAVCEAAPRLDLRLKWPNDLWLNGRKLSGILCECPPVIPDSPAIVVGVGLNVNARHDDFPPELRDTATSLAIAAGHDFPRPPILAAFLNHLESLLDQWQDTTDLTPFLPEWRRHDLLLGRDITIRKVNEDLPGTVVGYTPDGLLRLRRPDGTTITVSAGDVHIGRI